MTKFKKLNIEESKFQARSSSGDFQDYTFRFFLKVLAFLSRGFPPAGNGDFLKSGDSFPGIGYFLKSGNFS